MAKQKKNDEISDEAEDNEEEPEKAEEKSEGLEEETEEKEGEETFKISRIDFGEMRADSLESEVEETEGAETSIEGGEDFSDFSPARVHDITAPVLASAPASSAAGGIEGEVAGIAESESSRERREQAARTPTADYTAGAYEKNYWVGGEGARRETKDMEMSIIPFKPRRDIMEVPDETRRIDFSAWQRSMETQDARGTGRRERDNSEEYLVDVRREKEETRLPFERREEKRKYRV